MNITTGKLAKPQRVVIYGSEGIGKTTLASKFPKPIFLDTEGSTDNIDVARMDRPTSWSMLIQQVDYLINNEGSGYKTLVIDTGDWAERLCIRHVCDSKGVRNLGEIGCGNGFVALADEYTRFLNKLDILRNKGVGVVVVAHAQIKKFEQPDENGAYDRYELKLEKKTAPILKEWSDMLLFCNYKTIVVEIDGKKKAQGGQRKMFTEHRPAFDAKNRHGLKPELDFDFSSIAHCILDSTKTLPSPVVKKVDFISEEKENEDDLVFDPNKSETSQVPTSPNEKSVPGTVVNTQETAFNTELYDLMEASGITEKEIQWACAYPPDNKPGYYPIETSIHIYDEVFVKGMLVTNWSQIENYIKANRAKINN
jgi:hypothetical protein